MTKEQYKERKQDWSEKTDQPNKKDKHLANEISNRTSNGLLKIKVTNTACNLFEDCGK